MNPLTERKIRYELIIKLPNYHDQTCLKTVDGLIKQFPQLFKTTTCDNGAEFTEQSQLTEATSYYAHPSAPWK